MFLKMTTILVVSFCLPSKKQAKGVGGQHLEFAWPEHRLGSLLSLLGEKSQKSGVYSLGQLGENPELAQDNSP